MNFYENKILIKKKIDNVLHVNKKRVDNIINLCEYIGTEHFDNLSHEDKKISVNILKNIKYIGNKICEDLKDNENCFTCIYPKDLEIFDGIFYILSYNKNEENIKIPTFSKIPKNVSSYEKLIVIIDLRKNIQFVPWLNEL